MTRPTPEAPLCIGGACCCHVLAMLLPCDHILAMLLPCSCHALAMLLLGEASGGGLWWLVQDTQSVNLVF
jgi:hypothetical protein